IAGIDLQHIFFAVRLEYIYGCTHFLFESIKVGLTLKYLLKQYFNIIIEFQPLAYHIREYLYLQGLQNLLTCSYLQSGLLCT
ncbi:hypothetical protein KI387_000589, partial [Taxus chinensis]